MPNEPHIYWRVCSRLYPSRIHGPQQWGNRFGCHCDGFCWRIYLEEPSMSEQTLYRYWSGETLLYVGISINAYQRASQHSDNSQWWAEATHVTFEKYPSREDVIIAEKIAIRKERPIYNITHNSKTKDPFKLYGLLLRKQENELEQYDSPTRRAVFLERNRILTGIEALCNYHGVTGAKQFHDAGEIQGLPNPECCEACDILYDIWFMCDDPDGLASWLSEQILVAA
jgi:hypothetical protein